MEDLKTLEDVLEYANESLSVYGDKLLTLQNITDIYKLYLKLEKLSNLGITTQNYNTKVDAYFKNRKDLINDYELDNPKYRTHIPEYFPHDNPNTILIEIKSILVDAGLNSKQVVQFFKDAIGAKRTPDNVKVKARINSIFTNYTPIN